MKICFFIGGLTNVGGIGRVTSIIASELAKDADYEVYILSYSKNEKTQLYSIHPAIKHDYLLTVHTSAKKAILTGAVKQLRKYLLDAGIDVLVAGGALFYPFAVLASRNLGVKVIAWEHSNANNVSDYKYQGLARKIGARFADRVVTLTQADQELFHNKYGIKNITQIYNPIDSDLIKMQSEYQNDAKSIISVGRLSYQKNFSNLIDVAAIVLTKHKDWQWHIYGDGPEFEVLTDKIKSLGLTEKLHLKGRVDNLYGLYSHYSFLVMTSRYEGFPMTLLEGLSQGLPLISYDVETGPREIIQNEINGYLIQSENIDAMANSITSLIENSQKRVDMSIQSKAMTNLFSVNKIILDWKKLFLSL